jgi:RNA polymerase sigma-54 factor
MALSQNLQQKLLQKLSPQQIQLMKLLQVPTANLETRIKEEMEENPALELDEDIHDEFEEGKDEFTENGEEEYEEPDGSESEYENLDVSDYVQDGDDDIADYKLKDDNYPEEDEGRQLPHKSESSFFDMLINQLGLLKLDEKKRKFLYSSLAV